MRKAAPVCYRCEHDTLQLFQEKSLEASGNADIECTMGPSEGHYVHMWMFRAALINGKQKQANCPSARKCARHSRTTEQPSARRMKYPYPLTQVSLATTASKVRCRRPHTGTLSVCLYVQNSQRVVLKGRG